MHVCGVVCAFAWVDVYMCVVCVYMCICLYAYVCGMFALYFTSLTVLFSFSCPSNCVRLDVHF